MNQIDSMILKGDMKMTSIPRTAYILQIHKNPDQVNKFIQQLIIDNQADVFIHIDKRNYESLKDKIIKSPNVKVLKTSNICEWGDISQVDTTILLLREILSAKKNYNFVCLRSGQDLLVKDGFADFLGENKGKIFMTLRNVSRFNSGLMEIYWPKITRKRFTTANPLRIYRSIILSLYRKGINVFPNSNQWPKDYSLYNGAQWFSIPYEVAEYIIRFLDENEWYYKYFENTLAPDEWFFHTLIMNSSYKTDVVNNNLMFLKWGETLSTRNSPLVLTKKDINLIEESGQFFGRKFDESIDSFVVNYFANKVKFGKWKLTNYETVLTTK
ncbi:beta-1,6-N-acetylglucosaminyltransferase [Neobacillus drentensis]|uniref:beta-1,6-N-acetylglucosaminyltransferase n=1 Tax=Neobacillus drentensis TaxID=220684 RepID=UPI002FFDF771